MKTFQQYLIGKGGWALVVSFLLMTFVRCSSDDGPEVKAPVLEVHEARNVTHTTAEVSGIIDAMGNVLSECGFYYSQTKSALGEENGNLSNKKVLSDKSGTVSAQLNGLAPQTTYYYCLYAKSGKTEVRSSIGQFTTAEVVAPVVGNLIQVAAGEYTLTVKCCIVSDGGSSLQRFGIEYRKQGSATAWTGMKATSFDSSAEMTFTMMIRNLEVATPYEIRGFAVNEKGTGYSEVVVCTTQSLQKPVVSLFEIQPGSVGADFILVSAEISNLGAVTQIERAGFCWSTQNREPTYADNRLDVQPTGENKLEARLTRGIVPNQTYYVRAYAEGKIGDELVTGYSNVRMVQTKSVTKPSFLDIVVDKSSITTSTADVSCTLDGGNVTLVEKGFCYSYVRANPEVTNSDFLQVEGDVFRAVLRNLKEDKEYKCRAYVKYKEGEVEKVEYSQVAPFRTKSYSLPTVEVNCKDVTKDSFKVSGEIKDLGSGTFIEKGFCWSGVHKEPQIEDSKHEGMQKFTDADPTFSHVVTGLTPNTTYYVRSYVKTQVGNDILVGYSSVKNIRTSSLQSAYFEANYNGETPGKIELTGKITNLNDGELVKKVFCWSTNIHKPTPEEGRHDGMVELLPSDEFKHIIEGVTPGTQLYIGVFVYTKYGDTPLESNYFFTAFNRELAKADVRFNNWKVDIKSVWVQAQVSNLGDGAEIRRGFCWSTKNQKPTPKEGEHDGLIEIPAGAPFEHTIEGLNPDQNIYVAAFVETKWNETLLTGLYTMPLRTDALTKPDAHINGVDHVTDTSFSVQGVAYGGNTEITEVGFCWTTDRNQQPSGLEKHPAQKEKNNNFALDVTGLTVGGTYYVYSYATNEAGTDYSEAKKVVLKKVPQEGDNDSPDEMK